MLQRQTAYKMQVKNLLEGNAVFDGERFSAIECAGKSVLRVNVVGNVVDKYVNEEKRYCNLTIDDGSGQIRLKGFSDQFDLLKGPDIGDTIYIIGMMRYFNNELYVMPEIIRKADPIWLSVRSLELGVKYQEPGAARANNYPGPNEPQSSSAPTQIKIEKVFSESNASASTINAANAPSMVQIPQNSIDSPKLKILSIVKKEKETNLDYIMDMSGVKGEELNRLVNELVAEGEIYEIKPGCFCSVN